MSLVPYIQYSERVVGENSPLYTDVANRPLKYVIVQSGLDDTQDFYGFASGSVGSGNPENVITGRIGDIYGDRALTTAPLWVKISGSGTPAGWRSLLWNSGGTLGTIPKFGASGSLVDSIITEASGVATVTGSLVTTATGYFGATESDYALIYESSPPDGVLALNRFKVLRVDNAGTMIMGRVNGSLTSPTAILDTQRVGDFNFRGWTGTQFASAAGINAVATQDWTATTRGIKLQFTTAANSGGAANARWEIGQDGHFTPFLNATYNVGSAATAVLTTFTQNIDSGSATDLLLKRNAVTQLTLASSLATFVGDVAIGTGTVATTGRIRLANNSTGIQFRNAANNANIPALVVDNSNRVIIDSGTGGGIILRNVGFPYLTFSGATATFASSIGVILDNTGGYLQLGTSGASGLGRIRAKYNDLIMSARLNSGVGDVGILQYGGAGFTDITLIGGLKGTYLSAGSAGSTGGWYFNDTGAMSSSTNTITLTSGLLSYGRATISVTGTYPSWVSGNEGTVTALTLSATGGVHVPFNIALNVVQGDITVYDNKYRFPATFAPLSSVAGKVLTITSWAGLSADDPIILDWSLIAPASLSGFGAAGGYLRSDGSAWVRVQTLTPGVTNTEDVGATGNVWRTVYTPIIDSGSATDLLLKRNAVTQLTLASSSATFEGSLNVKNTLFVGSTGTGGSYNIEISGNRNISAFGIYPTITSSFVKDIFYFQLKTAATAVTYSSLALWRADSLSIGATSTITTGYIIKIDAQAFTGSTTAYGISIGNIAGATNNFAISTGLGLVSFGDTVQVAGTIRTGSATDLVLQRNSVTQLTLGSLLATFAGDVDLASGKVYKVKATQVVKARITGYTNLMTGTANRATAYDTSTITLVQLAERVKALEDDLHATAGHGLIGA